MASTDKIHLDLDSEERGEEYTDFVFSWKGRTLTLSDPANQDFRKIVEVENPLGFLRLTASQADRDFLASDEGFMEAWRLNRLMEKYYKHFGLDKERKNLGF